MMKRKNMKRILSGMLTFAVAICGFALFPDKTQAAHNEVVTYVVWDDYSDFKAKIDSHTAPIKEGYLFGGWFKYDEATRKGTVIETAESVSEQDTVAAKYIREDMSGIACQLNLDRKDGTRDMRIVSLVDSTTYSAVGFNVYGRKNDDPLPEEWLMYSFDSNEAEYTTVYSGLKEYSDEEHYELKQPQDIFGDDANGFKFTTMCLTGIPDTDYDTIVAIKPYWFTKDGTYVEGLGEFNRVNDYVNGIVNVSVNLKQATAIAAGALKINYPDAFEYIEADYGRIFEEMEIVNSEGDYTIHCVGYVSDVTNNANNPNEVYVNLRFKKTEQYALKAGEASFNVTVPEKGFCNNKEEIVKVYAPSVKY